MQSSSTFMRMSRLMPEVKKICIDQWLGKYYCVLGRFRAKWGAGEQVWFVLNTVKGSRGGTAGLNIETVFPALKLAQNRYKKMIISFSWKLEI